MADYDDKIKFDYAQIGGVRLHYAIAGEGWELAYLQDLVRDLNVADLVQFCKVVSDDELIRCYQQCDLFALPNRQVGWDFEGFGIVLLEAQACGRAVIAGRSGGSRGWPERAMRIAWKLRCRKRRM